MTARERISVATVVASLTGPALMCAPSLQRPTGCDQIAQPVTIVELPGNPFQAIATVDGCHAIVSLVGPVEPGDPPRQPRPDAPKGGVAVVRLGTTPVLERVLPLDGSPYGMAQSTDGRLLVVASADRIAFVDSAKLTAGEPEPVLGYLTDSPTAGRVYASITSDDRWLFVSDESTRSISVIDLVKARASGFAAGAVVGRIPVGRAPIALTFSPDERLLYTTSQIAPDDYRWAPVCSPPLSERARQGPAYAQGAILVVDVARATREPAQAVIGSVAAGCNPVRLVLSPRGDRTYVSARTDNAVLVFDTKAILANPAQALLARVPVGDAPVGLAILDRGARVAVTNSNRFADGNGRPSLAIIDAEKIHDGRNAVIGSISTGSFPRELRLTPSQRILLLTNFGSKTLAVMDVTRLAMEPPPIKH